VQEEKMIRLLGAGTLSLVVIILCVIFGILTRPKAVATTAPTSFNSQDNSQTAQINQPQPQGQVAGAETTQTIQTATQTTPPAATAGQNYTVQAGDTLYAIALQFKKNWQDIAKANNISDSTSLHVGQVLIIP
jgi:LysM repeat protein